MFLKQLGRAAPGQLITASAFNEIMEVAEHSTRLRVAAPLAIKYMPGGALLSVTVQKGFLAVANGSIPARSGSSAGIGSVYAVGTTVAFSGGTMSSCTLTAGSTPYQVYNPSSTTMSSGQGINSGQYCWTMQDQNGMWMVVPLECA